MNQEVSEPKHIDEKICNHCCQNKSILDYYKNYNKCKECVKEAQRARNKINKEKEIALKSDPHKRTEPKHCYKCDQIKTVNDFRINRSECIECERDYGRQYNIDNYDIRHKWTQNNLERLHQLQVDWYKRNKPHIQAKYSSRYNEDYTFKVSCAIKRCIRSKISKITTTKTYVGTDFERVADWLKYNFTPEMTWENHGTVWDIDHVIPISKWDLNIPEHINICFNWKNLSPLSCFNNRHVKSNNIDNEQIIRHKTQLIKYFEDKQLDKEELTTYLEKYNQQLTLLGETP